MPAKQGAMRDSERLQRVADGLSEDGLDALVCTLPSRVLLLSGYFPVVGTSLAIATRERRVLLIVPEDELELVSEGDADEILCYKPERLERIQTVVQSAIPVLREAAQKLKLAKARIGFEFGPASEPSSYSAMNLFAGATRGMLSEAIPGVTLEPADGLLARLSSIKTPHEVERIRAACQVAGAAFEKGSQQFRPGMSEFEAASLVRNGFSALSSQHGNARADGFAWCMSGPNSAKAAGAYARSRHRRLAPGDLVLTHANSTIGGYWTDITRTYTVGAPDEKQRQLYAAVWEARRAALELIAPGTRTCEIDWAAREVLAQHGLAKDFKHSAGHGVGFSAISANALPRIHPASEEALEMGMVFNLEPAVYLDGYGGIRHCDMVAVGVKNVELLTPFQCDPEGLVLQN